MNVSHKTYTMEAAVGKKYDVIVCGGGTAGCIAAIAAARAGADTLLIERSFSVGGMLTIGNAGITKYTVHYTDEMEYRQRVLQNLGSHPEQVQVVGGLPKEYVERMIRSGCAVGTEGQAGSYVFADRYGSQWTMMDMLDEAGVTVLYDTRVCGVSMNENVVEGVLVHNKSGFTEYSAEQVIDATADADVAVMAGAEFCVGVTQEDMDEGCGAFAGQMLHAGSMFRVRNVNIKQLLSYLQENPELFIVHDFGVMMQDDVMDSAMRGEMAVFRMWVDMPDGKRIPMQVYKVKCNY